MSAGRSIFITATDTGVGKTMVSGLLLGFLHRKGIAAGYQKWASSGATGIPADLAACLRIAGLEKTPDRLDRQIPYRFAMPASPHLAAEREGEKIDPERIIDAYRKMAAEYEVLIVEGIGGLLVPLSRELLLADLLARLKLPTIVVARSGLGTINHTLLSIEALRSRQIPLIGVVFTDSAEEDEIIGRDNMRIVAEMGRVEVLGRLPYCREEKELSRAFVPLGEKIGAVLLS